MALNHRHDGRQSGLAVGTRLATTRTAREGLVRVIEDDPAAAPVPSGSAQVVLGSDPSAAAGGAALWLIVGAALCALTGVANAADRPNVLLIAIDDLNDWVGHLGGHPQAKTPNIDALARRGVRFTNAYTAAPECNPSRAAMFSGKRPSTSGIYNNTNDWRPHLPPALMLPTQFRERGIPRCG